MIIKIYFIIVVVLLISLVVLIYILKRELDISTNNFKMVQNGCYSKIDYLEKKIVHIENNRKKFLDPNEKHKNKDILDNMSNTEFLWFIKDRLALPFFCRMCERFNAGNNLDPTVCQFKGLHKICDKGYREWLERCNNLEGDMDANIE